ncbi:MAG TPA: GspH/FimT family pseudopilin [Gemmatimonadales bacterium]|nr:GspH/FimT family pseudopilin [Gemmatimonadales bacterium]
MTVAVIAIMATLAIPFILTATRSLTMSRGAREIQAALLQARMVAITTRQNICFQPVTGGYAYRKATCAGTAWTGPNTDATGTFRPADNVALSGGAAIFTPFGTPSQTTVITVSVLGGNSTTVTVQPSGRVTIP